MMNQLGVKALCVVALVLAACSSDDGDQTAASGGGSPAPGGLAAGTTPCGNFPDSVPKTCQAGQYCGDEGFSECQNGCLSEANCTSQQTCNKEAGADVGSCQAVAVAVSCSDFCAKLQACDPSITQAQCDQACEGLNDTCKSCIVAANCTELMKEPAPACASECGV